MTPPATPTKTKRAIGAAARGAAVDDRRRDAAAAARARRPGDQPADRRGRRHRRRHDLPGLRRQGRDHRRRRRSRARPRAARSRARRTSRPTSRSRTRLAAAVVLIQQRVIDIWRLVSSVGTRFHEMTRRPITDSDALVGLFAAHRDRIRVEPTVAARLVARARRCRRRIRCSPANPCRPTSSSQLFLHGVGGGGARRAEQAAADAPRPVPQHAAAHRRAADGARRRPRSTLPTINARIIDNGVIPGDVGYIWTWGGVMLVLRVRAGRVRGRGASTTAARSR